MKVVGYPSKVALQGFASVRHRGGICLLPKLDWGKDTALSEITATGEASPGSILVTTKAGVSLELHCRTAARVHDKQVRRECTCLSRGGPSKGDLPVGRYPGLHEKSALTAVLLLRRLPTHRQLRKRGGSPSREGGAISNIFIYHIYIPPKAGVHTVARSPSLNGMQRHTSAG